MKDEVTDDVGGRVLSYRFNVDGVDGFDDASQPTLVFQVEMPPAPSAGGGGGDGEPDIQEFPLSTLVSMLFEDNKIPEFLTEKLVDVDYAGLGVQLSGRLHRVARIILQSKGIHASRVLFTLEPANGRGPSQTLMLRDIKGHIVEHLQGDTLKLYNGNRGHLACCNSPAPASSRGPSSAIRSASGQKGKIKKKQSATTASRRKKLHAFKGRKVRKWFDTPPPHGAWYEGVVTELSADLYYKVVYEDGDTEEYTVEELQEILVAVSYTHLTLPTIYSV